MSVFSLLSSSAPLSALSALARDSECGKQSSFRTCLFPLPSLSDARPSEFVLREAGHRISAARSNCRFGPKFFVDLEKIGLALLV